MPATLSTPTLSLEAAKVALAGSEAKARALQIPMNIAVVGASTHLLHFSRMDGAKLTSISIAIDKAFTAAGHRAPTSVWPGGAAYGIGMSNGGRFMTIAGGVPVRGKDGEVLGAVGCSTGTPAQDEEVARAGVEAVERFVREGGGRAKL
ncbi:hypothetical protein LTR16_009192 [Cryomyces antarcticus]|uniref:DUF336-domain-containing protein n=1 Tax=Cryomyces antarcticus TaxID=329879 RepID=A0ABR0M2V2_9PEZI|nr:hypothetical protein LTR16_009192 [Cryomyces antarcticus]